MKQTDNSCDSLILASKSPRRRQILEQTGLSFSIMVSDLDEGAVAREVHRNHETESVNFRAELLCTELAKRKAQKISLLNPNAVVIGADTVVVTEYRILGHPDSVSEARDMLLHLSGRTHMVYTGGAIASASGTQSFCEKTNVTFCPPDHDQHRFIELYLRTGSPMDKAGAYGIQDLGATLIERIDGDYYNVMGLPLARLCRELRQIDASFFPIDQVEVNSESEDIICPDSY